MAGPEAKAGIENEDYIVNTLNQFRNNEEAKKWLEALDYDVSKIKKLEAKRSLKMGLGNIKSDVILFVNQNAHGIQIKKSRKGVNFNHIQRGWTNKFCKELNAPSFISDALKKFAGEDGFQPMDYMSEKELEELQSKRKKKGFSEKKIQQLTSYYKRILLSELEEKERKEVFAWFEKNKEKIVTSVLRGNDKNYQPRHLLVVEHAKGKITRIGIITMLKAIQYFTTGDVVETTGGTVLWIGKIKMQRHGAEKSEGKNAQHLQFKINPLGVFEIPSCKIFPKKKPKKTKRGK